MKGLQRGVKSNNDLEDMCLAVTAFHEWMCLPRRKVAVGFKF